MNAVIRLEQPSDIAAIFALTKSAFATASYSEGTEQLIVDALRSADELTSSLVVEADGELIGHIAFSPVTISDGTQGWYGLGPVSVLPAFQRQGIGQALIREGLSRLKTLGAKGCVLLGDPMYYRRFGANNPDLTLAGVLQEHFLALPFVGSSVKGAVSYHDAFSTEK